MAAVTEMTLIEVLSLGARLRNKKIDIIEFAGQRRRNPTLCSLQRQMSAVDKKRNINTAR